MIKNFEQSEVWGGFRVGRRAKVFDLKQQKIIYRQAMMVTKE